MTQLETAMAILMKTFDTYAAGEGKKDTLSNAEAKTLLEKELPGLRGFLPTNMKNQRIFYEAWAPKGYSSASDWRIETPCRTIGRAS